MWKSDNFGLSTNRDPSREANSKEEAVAVAVQIKGHRVEASKAEAISHREATEVAVGLQGDEAALRQCSLSV